MILGQRSTKESEPSDAPSREQGDPVFQAVAGGLMLVKEIFIPCGLSSLSIWRRLCSHEEERGGSDGEATGVQL